VVKASQNGTTRKRDIEPGFVLIVLFGSISDRS